MSLYLMIVIIVVVGCTTGVLNNYFRHKAIHASRRDDLAQRLQDLEDLIRNRLEKRIANLEAIITDKEFEIKSKFDAL